MIRPVTRPVRLRPFLLPILLAGVAGCSPSRMALRTMAPLLERGSAAFDEEADPRLARDGLGAQLLQLEALLKTDPGQPALRLLAARGFGAYAYLFLEDPEPERAKGFYLRGRDHALRLLARREPLAAMASLPLDGVLGALAWAKPEDARALFWAAYGWGGFINLSKDSPDAVADLPKAAALMARARELEPAYEFRGADLFLGVYYAARPKMFGGDPARSKTHFDAAMADGRFRLAKVLCAQYYAVATQDGALFERLLGEVVASKDDFPPARLANAVAVEKARKLLEKKDELF